MNTFLLLVLQSLWLIFPAYIANAVPVIVGGKTPIDFGRTFFDKRPVFGPGKTWRGAASGIAAGAVVAYIQGIFGESYGMPESGFIPMTAGLGLLLGTGAITGDVVKSFFKRRLGFKRGQKLFLADQIDFLLGALLFASVKVKITIPVILILLVITPLIHRATNIFAHKRGLKNVPW